MDWRAILQTTLLVVIATACVVISLAKGIQTPIVLAIGLFLLIYLLQVAAIIRSDRKERRGRLSQPADSQPAKGSQGAGG